MAAPIGNKYGLGNHTAGRPPKYDNPEALEAKVMEYFTYCEGEFHMEKRTVKRKRKDPETGKNKMVDVEEEIKIWDRPDERPTWTRLALFLGFESRQSLNDYAKREAFSYPIKRALLIIESLYEDGLYNTSVAGVIFALKNLGWVDQQDINHKGEVNTNNLSGLTDDQLRERLANLRKQRSKS